MPDFKTIADFRKDNGEAIRQVCREFVVPCCRLELFNEASIAVTVHLSLPPMRDFVVFNGANGLRAAIYN